MEISINSRYFNKEKREYLLDLANWTGTKLMGPRLSRNLNLTIDVMSKKDYLKGSLYAYTEITDDENKRNPRDFTITMTNRVGIMRSLIILAHEMVHVKQYARNELSYSNRTNNDLWMGKPLGIGNIDYWDLPYEIEANGREKGLVYQWCNSRKLCDKNWYRKLF